MARIVSIFQFTGRAGSAVGYKGKNGKIALRQYQPSMADRRTQAQMSQRAKIKLASQVAGMLGEVGRTALIANGQRKTDRGQLIKQLLKSIKVNGTKASLGYDLNLVNNPSYAESISVVITSETSAFVATFSGAAEGEVIAKAILVHDLATGNWRRTSGMDSNTTIAISKSANEAGDALEVFAYGIVLQPKTNEGFNNIGQTGANSTGYVIDLNMVNSSNFAFSPCVSAALNVEGDGTTSGGNGSSGPSTGSGTGSGSDTVQAPTISGTTPFAETTQVSITGPDDARVYYTTDGTTPTSESTLYTAAFTLSATTTVKAVAIKEGISSSVTTKTFTKAAGGGNGGDDPFAG